MEKYCGIFTKACKEGKRLMEFPTYWHYMESIFDYDPYTGTLIPHVHTSKGHIEDIPDRLKTLYDIGATITNK